MTWNDEERLKQERKLDFYANTLMIRNEKIAMCKRSKQASCKQVAVDYETAGTYVIILKLSLWFRKITFSSFLFRITSLFYHFQDSIKNLKRRKTCLLFDKIFEKIRNLREWTKLIPIREIFSRFGSLDHLNLPSI